MQTQLPEPFRSTRKGQEADEILRRCVHCGFCNATCPTYQLLGDELDGPRGRIYLIKQMLEGQDAGANTRLHLDRCLTCRNCETTCPSGVEYGRLLEIGRDEVETRMRRPWHERAMRRLLRMVVPYPRRLRPLVWIAGWVRSLLPRSMASVLPRRKRTLHPPAAEGSRGRVLLLEGCAQSVLAPEINQATRSVLQRTGFEVVTAPQAGCCGALSLHLGETEEALGFMRRNIDAWWPAIESGIEAIVTNASGCGVTVKDYGRLLADDPDYADKARIAAERTREISELLTEHEPDPIARRQTTRIAFHAPCTLQHGMKLGETTARLLQSLGFTLTTVPDAHLCCGSAGTYSILQKRLARPLTENKVRALQSDAPEIIASANIGCILELRKRARVPVVHWIQLLDENPIGSREAS